MKSYVKQRVTTLLGVAACVAGCAKPAVIEVEPVLCPSFTEQHLDEYETLGEGTNTLRAWIREAERACRANEETVYGEVE